MAQRTKVYVDWGKLVQVALLITATVVLGITETIDKSTVTLVIGAATGYVFGNGKSVKHGTPPAPLIGRRELEDGEE
jgi:hypothetical protein